MDTVILIGVGRLFVGSLAWSIARAAKKEGGCSCGCGECPSACVGTARAEGGREIK